MYASEIDAAVRRWGSYYGVSVPAPLVAAMIQVESSGNPRAKRTEPDGRVSRGLLQVLEDTARSLGVKDVIQLHNPAVGIDVGVHYLASQLKRYGGDVLKAVAAYNAGSARYAGTQFKNQGYVDKVVRWWKLYGAAAVTLGPAIVAGLVLLFFLARRRRG